MEDHRSGICEAMNGRRHHWISHTHGLPPGVSYSSAAIYYDQVGILASVQEIICSLCRLGAPRYILVQILTSIYTWQRECADRVC